MNILRFSANHQNRHISQICKEIGKSSSHSLPNKFAHLMKVLFPSEKISPIAQIYEDAIILPTITWTARIQQILSILEGKSEFGQALVQNRDIRIDLHAANLGRQYEQFLSEKSVAQKLNVKKQMNRITIPILECWMVKLVDELVNLKEYQRKSSWKESFQSDQFQFHLLRNPIIHLISSWLNYARPIGFVYHRLISVLDYGLVRYPIFKFRKNEGLTIKTHHFYGIYLMFEWRPQSIIWEFLSFIVEYLQTKQKNFNSIFICWIRIHFILLKGKLDLNLEQRLKSKKQLFPIRIDSSSQESIENIFDEIGQIKDSTYLQSLQYQIQSLLSKEFWHPTPQFLATIFSILHLFKSVSNKNKQVGDEIGRCISKYYSISRKQPQMDRILSHVTSIYARVGGEYKFNQQQPYQFETRASFFKEKRGNLPNRRSFKSFRREANPWEASVKSYESHLIYAASYSLSKMIDRLRGRQSFQYPITNLRFLASFKTIAIVVVLLLMIFLYY